MPSETLIKTAAAATIASDDETIELVVACAEVEFLATASSTALVLDDWSLTLGSVDDAMSADDPSGGPSEEWDR